MNKDNSIEELMKPRKRIIALWPGSMFNVGNILYYDDERIEAGYWYSLTESGVKFYVTDPHLYPHLFKPLAWYEDREASEMPEYVKEIDNKYHKVKYSEEFGFLYMEAFDGVVKSNWAVVPNVMCFFEPATEADYLSYIKSIKK